MRVGILTGGGDCRALNAVIRATVKTSVGFGWEVSGIEEGFDGLVHSRIRRMNITSVSGILHLGGTILGTTNAANPFSYPILAEGGKASVRVGDGEGVSRLFAAKSRTALICSPESAIARPHYWLRSGANHSEIHIVGFRPSLVSHSISAP